MWISCAYRFKVLILLLIIASSTLADESVYDNEYESSSSTDDSDNLPLESSNSEVNVEPDDTFGKESKNSLAFTKDPHQTKKPTRFKIKLQNVTEEKYNYVQWSSEPTDDINHHVIDSQRTNGETLKKATVHDLNAQSSSYEEGYHGDHYHDDDPDHHHYEPNVKQRHHDHDRGHHPYDTDTKQRHQDSGHPEREPSVTHYHHDHDDGHYHYDHGGAHVHSFHHQGHSGEDMGEKRKLKKIKKKCLKGKSEARYPGGADTITHSLSKSNRDETSHYGTNEPKMVPQGRFSPSPKLESVLPLLEPSGITGPHLHDVPRVQYFKQKTSEKGNHIHLHNHHHHYNAEGKRIALTNEPPLTGVQGYGNLMKSLGKLRSLLPLALAGMNGKQNLGVEGFQFNQGLQGFQKNQRPQDFYEDQRPKGYDQNPGSQNFQLPQHSQGAHLPTENGVPDVKLASDSPKKGYHYTGPYKSYGRKTYYRMKDGEYQPSSDSGEHSRPGYGSGESSQDVAYPNEGSYNIAEDMLKYGTGPYATDEFNEDGGERHYPNEVSLGVDRDPPRGGYSDSHSNTGYSHSDSHSPASYSQSDTHSPDGYSKPHDTQSHGGYSQPYDSQSHGGHSQSHNSHSHGGYSQPHDTHSLGGYSQPHNTHSNNGYSHSHDDHSPSGYNQPSRHPSTDYDSGLNHEHKDSPDYEEKAPYVPYDQIEANRAKEGGYGLRQNSQDIPYEGKIGGILENLGPVSVDPPSDSVSYVQDGVEQHFYDPEKHHMFRDLKPEPDPLSIPKNARVIEHHIRLHPMHYTMFPQIPVDLDAGRNVLPSPGFQQHIPMHKLIPDPLKMPNLRPPPMAVHPNPQLNEMLHAYQSRNVYHRWW